MSTSAAHYLQYVTIGIIVLAGWGQSNAAIDHSKLPFGGQFPVARINGADFMTQIGIPPVITPSDQRNYSVFILMNTLDASLNCPSCSAFDREFAKVAAKVDAKERLNKKVHFVTLEYKDNQELFIKARVSQVPSLFYLPPTTNYPASRYENFVQIGPVPGAILQFIEIHSDVKTKKSIKPKIGMIMFSFGAVLVIVALAKLYIGKAFLRILFSYELWGIFSVGFIILMTSGYMWVRIRGVPYTMYNRLGLQFLSPGVQNQLGIESQIVGSLNCLAAIAMIVLSTKVPKICNSVVRRVAIFVCMLVLVLSFSAEVALFRRKVPSYPFRLLIS